VPALTLAGSAKFANGGPRRAALRLTRRGHVALRRPGRMRVTVTARYKPPAATKASIRRARLLLRRSPGVSIGADYRFRLQGAAPARVDDRLVWRSHAMPPPGPPGHPFDTPA
jgi:hypothetical protein